MQNTTIFSNWFTFSQMTKRNISLFTKDKTTVFFSFLAPLIILLLFVLFLGDLQVSNIEYYFEKFGMEINSTNIDAFVNSWLISGVLATSCITISLNSLGVMVNDRYLKITRDYAVSPVKSYIVMLSYFMASFIITFVLTLGVYFISLLYLFATGGFFMSVAEVFEVIAILILSCLSSTLIMMVLVTFIKSPSALGAFGGIISAVIGFLIGAYMPISTFPEPVQYIANIIPGSHSAGLLRNVIMSGSLNNMTEGYAPAFAAKLSQNFSLNLNLFKNEIGKEFMYIYLSSSIVVFSLINLIIYKYKREQ